MAQLSRSTKYSKAVMLYLDEHGHATNGELVTALHAQWPELSATTVHRITARLAEQNDIAIAPKDTHGNLRYDANTTKHHHFYCTCCDSLRDITLDASVLQSLEAALSGCKLKGDLLINGSCGMCSARSNKKE